MNNLIYALKELGFLSDSDTKNLFSISSFKERLFFQKLVFLLNELTDELGDYSYNWYLRGPYSPRVSDDLYNIRDIIRSDNTHISHFLEDLDLNEDLFLGIEDIKKLRGVFREEFGHDWTANDLEILASLVFIEKHTSLKDKGQEEIIKEFKNRKPNLKNRPLDSYYLVLKKINLIG